MSDQPGADGASGTAQAWDSVRRVREPVAWALLVLTAIIVLVTAGQLFNLPGARLPVIGGPAPSAFALRATLVTPQFVAAIVIAPPVLSVVLVAFSGGLTEHARHVLQAAVAVQAVTLVLGVISVAGAAGSNQRPGTWIIFEATGLAITATALVFTTAVTRSQAVRALAPRFEALGDDDDCEDDPDSEEHD